MKRFSRRAALLSLLAVLVALAPAAYPVLANELTVRNTNNSGPDSLRQAILDANNSPGGDTINFNIPTTDAGHSADGYWTIRPTSPLPEISGGAIFINGTSQPNGRTDGPKIVLDGSSAGTAYGLSITSADNMIKGLVINQFRSSSVDTGGAGVYIAGPDAARNTVIGCWIGTTPDGASAASNSYWGVLVDDGAHDNTIGGTGAGARNVISGNGTVANVEIAAFKADSSNITYNNKVIGNYIGTTPSGQAAIGGSGNSGDGVLIGRWSQNNTVGGTAPGAGNVIAGHNNTSPIISQGVNVTSSANTPSFGNLIAGNYIGVGADGTTAIPNAIGVRIGGVTNTLVGGPSAARNIISGNSQDGVLVEFISTGTVTITNNLIGLDLNGAARGNGGAGVLLQRQAVGVTIGPGNVISSNGTDANGVGVRITNPGAESNIVKGNYISTDRDGLTTAAAYANKGGGVLIDDGAHDNTIGGPAAGDRNVIAGQGFGGVHIVGPARANHVEGNYIGVNKLGNAPLTGTVTPGSIGVLIDDDNSTSSTTNNTVGGSGRGNLIGANETGIKIVGAGSTGNLVKGNYIGLDKTGAVALGNSFYGVWLFQNATNNTVGGTGQGEGNLIANGYHGVQVDAASNNQIVGNRLTNNSGNGVRVGSGSGILISRTETSQNGFDGISLASGANGSHNPPTIQLNGATLTGNAAGCANCTIEIFTSPTREDGEGPRYLKETTTDGNGDFSVDAGGCDAYLTATARYPGNNSTAFAKPMVGVCTSPQPDVQLGPGVPASAPEAPQIAAPGAQVVYTHVVTNTGQAPGLFSIARTTSQGWASAPNPSSVTLAAGQSQTIMITVTIPLTATADTLDITTVTASVDGKSQSQSDYTRAARVFGVQIAPDHSGVVTATSLVSVSIDYTHIVTNTGNATDTITITAATSAPGASAAFLAGDTCLLPAGDACTRAVRVTFPPGTSAVSDTTIVTATASNGASDQARDITTIAQGAVPLLLPDHATREVQPVTSTVVFTHTVTNIGRESGTFTVTVQPSAPLGWTFALSEPTSFDLGPGVSQPVTLTVTVPAGAAAGPQHVILTASSADASAQATDTITVAASAGLLFAPDHSGVARPGEVLTYTHTLTNTSNATGSFTITLAIDPLWSADVTPTLVSDVPSGGTRLVTVTVTAPTGVVVGSSGIVTATATSTLVPQLQASVRDTTTITAQVAAALLPPLQSAIAAPIISSTEGLAFTQLFTHTLINSGSLTSTFTIAATGDQGGWPISIDATAIGPLAPGQSATVVVRIGVPAGTLPGTIDIVTVEVRDQEHPDAVLSTAQDTLSLPSYEIRLPEVFTTS